EEIRECEERLARTARRPRPETRQALARGERPELRPIEVEGEPPLERRARAGHAGRIGQPDDATAGGELWALGDVRRLGDLGLVPHDEHAVATRHEVRLDRVGAELEARADGCGRVLGMMPART